MKNLILITLLFSIPAKADDLRDLNRTLKNIEFNQQLLLMQQQLNRAPKPKVDCESYKHEIKHWAQCRDVLEIETPSIKEKMYKLCQKNGERR